MIQLTDKENNLYEDQKECYIYKKEFCYDKNKVKKFKLYQNVRDHYTGKIRGVADSICNLSYKVPKETPLVIQNGSTYDYRYIIKQLAEKFKYQFKCLGEKQKNILLFQYQLKKNMIMVKQLHTN